VTSYYKTLIIGAGFGGLCMGIKLKEQGDEDFVILEKADNVGGTWQENTYPGAGCDIPSALYSYSFKRKYDWSGKWAKQPEILEYIQECVEDYGLAPYLQFGRAVESAVFKDKKWQVSLSTGEVISCQFLVSAIGQLHHPKTPHFDGIDDFEGHAFHSARWDHSIDLSDKHVAVIGNAASGRPAKCLAWTQVVS